MFEQIAKQRDLQVSEDFRPQTRERILCALFSFPGLVSQTTQKTSDSLGFLSSSRKRASFSRNQSYDWSLSNEGRSLFLLSRQSFVCHVFLLPGISSSLLSHLSLVICLSSSSWVSPNEREREADNFLIDLKTDRSWLTCMKRKNPESLKQSLKQSLWNFTANPKSVETRLKRTSFHESNPIKEQNER